MIWEHKGTNIELSGSLFTAVIDDKRIALSSLNAIKKAIDKHLDAKAKEVVLHLPVVIRISQHRWSGNPKVKDRVIKAVITGIDSESKFALGLDVPEGWTKQEVLPDTPENAARLESLIDAEMAHSAAEEKIRGRTVGTSFAGYGRNKRTYSEAVQLLQKSYDDAKKSRSNE